MGTRGGRRIFFLSTRSSRGQMTVCEKAPAKLPAMNRSQINSSRFSGPCNGAVRLNDIFTELELIYFVGGFKKINSNHNIHIHKQRLKILGEEKTNKQKTGCSMLKIKRLNRRPPAFMCLLISSQAPNLSADSGAILMTLSPLPRHNPLTPPSRSMYFIASIRLQKKIHNKKQSNSLQFSNSPTLINIPLFLFN